MLLGLRVVVAAAAVAVVAVVVVVEIVVAAVAAAAVVVDCMVSLPFAFPGHSAVWYTANYCST